MARKGGERYERALFDPGRKKTTRAGEPIFYLDCIISFSPCIAQRRVLGARWGRAAGPRFQIWPEICKRTFGTRDRQTRERDSGAPRVIPFLGLRNKRWPLRIVRLGDPLRCACW